MLFPRLLLSGLLAVSVHGQSTTSLTDSRSGSSSSSRSSRPSSSSSQSGEVFTFADGRSASTISTASASVPSGPYQSYNSQRPAPSLSSSSTNTHSNGTASATTSNTLLIVGGASSSTTNSTATHTTSTSSSSAPTNTQACNGHVDFCSKRYMNFTQVCAHNSAFSIPNNAASNQQISIIGQLNDGIRMIQGETHYGNNTIYSCHTSCNLLNAGPLSAELSTVRSWVETHPYDVLTILLVNSDYRNVTDYVAPLQDSGLMPYLYTPPKIPMYASDWPILSSMILTGKRVVVFMDYMANQTAVPYVLDEFSQMWETPFSPTDDSFPCTQQRPPNLSDKDKARLPYLANHNLNIEVTIAGTSLLIPQFDALNQTNSVNGTQGMGDTGSLGAMADSCNASHGRPPAWLLVDFYNRGNFAGSVFEVAARMNNVTYDEKCCGMVLSVSKGTRLLAMRLAEMVVGFAAFVGAVVGLGLV